MHSHRWHGMVLRYYKKDLWINKYKWKYVSKITEKLQFKDLSTHHKHVMVHYNLWYKVCFMTFNLHSTGHGCSFCAVVGQRSSPITKVASKNSANTNLSEKGWGGWRGATFMRANKLPDKDTRDQELLLLWWTGRCLALYIGCSLKSRSMDEVKNSAVQVSPWNITDNNIPPQLCERERGLTWQLSGDPCSCCCDITQPLWGWHCRLGGEVVTLHYYTLQGI